MFVRIFTANCCVLHIVDAGTAYSKCEISADRPARCVTEILKRKRINRHRASSYFSTDLDFTREPIKRFLDTLDVRVRGRPVSRHIKTGIVERKQCSVKAIIGRLQPDKSTESNSLLPSLATFLFNLFSGSIYLSSFELARVYKPALLSIESRFVNT